MRGTPAIGNRGFGSCSESGRKRVPECKRTRVDQRRSGQRETIHAMSRTGKNKKTA